MITLELTPEERDEIVKILENTLAETKIEFRRTRNPGWRDEIQKQEDILVAVLERLSHAPSY